MSEFKPCPRCKEALRLSVQTNHEFYGPDESLYFFVLCSACGHSSHSGYSREEAIKDWNTRPIEDALRAENERLKTENEQLKDIRNKFSRVWNENRQLKNGTVLDTFNKVVADNARMREALQELYNLNLCPDYKTGASRENLFAEIAREALKAVSDVQ